MPLKFLSFPLEIRLKVYAALLVPEQPIALSSVLYNQPDDSDPGGGRAYTNILCASRQVSREATEVFWAQNSFLLDPWTVISLLKLFNPPRRRSNSSNSSGGTGGVSRGNVKEKLSNVRQMQYHVACSLQKHPQLEPPQTPRCVHVVFNSQSMLRDVVQLFYTPEQPPRKLALVLDAGSMPKDRVAEDNLLVDFEHAQLKKLNYKSEDPPWATGNTIDVLAGALKGLKLPHSVTLRMDTWIKTLPDPPGVVVVDIKSRDLTGVLTEKIGLRLAN